MEIRFITDPNLIRQKLESVPGKIGTAVTVAMWTIVTDLQLFIQTEELQGQVLQTHTGRLSRAVVSDVESGGGQVVGSVGVDESAPYGAVQEMGGLNEYLIEPRDRLALHFMMGGESVFAKRVIHPPLPERSFVRRALEIKLGSIEAKLRGAVGQALA